MSANSTVQRVAAGVAPTPVTSGRPASFDYIPTLDGWRALSVLGVVWFHCSANSMHAGSIWAKVGARGHLGVAVFFAISGFLICGKLLQELRQTGTISFKRFYIRRCFRIFPAVWLYLGALALFRALGWVRSSGWEFESTLLFVRNYFPLFFHRVVVGRFTAQFWSLAVEEHFYLLCPVLMVILKPSIRRIGWTVGITACAVSLWRMIDSATGWFIPFGSDVGSKTDTQIDALLWGCLAAVVYGSIRERLSPSTLHRSMWLLLCFGILAAALKLLEVDICRSVFFPALLICTVSCPDSILGQFLEVPLMKWFGKISFSLYIWQQLFTFPTLDQHSPLRFIEHCPENFLGIVLIAAASYYFVEQPMVQLSHKLTAGSSPVTGNTNMSIMARLV